MSRKCVIFVLGVLAAAGSYQLPLVAADLGQKAAKGMVYPVQKKRITGADINSLPSGKRFVIDLTKGSSVFELDATATPIDWNRVDVRTSKGPLGIQTWLKGVLPKVAAGGMGKGILRVGATKAFFGPKVGKGGGKAVFFTCSGLRCDCEGDDDCNDMFGSGVCGDIAACWEASAVHCACLRF